MNITRQRQDLMDQFRRHFQQMEAAMAESSLYLGGLNATATASINSSIGDIGFDPVGFNPSNWSDFGESLDDGYNSFGQWSANDTFNQSVQLPNLPSANVTTLATYIMSQGPNEVFRNMTTQALNLLFLESQGGTDDGICRRETSLLFLLLMLGTVWMAVSLFNFNKT